MKPKVSVIIPAYNKAELTRRTIDSVLRQTYQNIEIIVIDDGSMDTTPQTMALYGDKITYVRKLNGGACSARNEGFRRSSGEYIAWLDCDDLYLPDKIELSVRYLEHHPAAGFVHTAAYFIDINDRVVGLYSHPKSHFQSAVLKRLIMKNFICNSTVMARRSCVEAAGYFDESIFIPADWDMWLRLAEKATVGYMDASLTMYRVTDNYTFNRLEKAQEEEKTVINHFFTRNPRLVGLKALAMANWNIRFAQCYLLKANYTRFRQELITALKRCPYYWKTWAMAIGAVIIPRYLKNNLSRRILRHG
jgi:glycosyltransferase involved in cell wall biosynthesis